MKLYRHLPNMLTLCNLACGVLGIMLLANAGDCGDCTTDNQAAHAMQWAFVLILAAGVFDFLDGAVARLLKVSSPIGKDLDSLADLVTFGVLPGMMVFTYFSKVQPNTIAEIGTILPTADINWGIVGLLIPLFSALRLAKFNNDTRQTSSFIGLPTPANALFIGGIITLVACSNWTSNIIGSTSEMQLGLWTAYPILYVTATVLFSLLLVSPVPMFALKFKNLGWTDNKIRFIFLGLAALLIIAAIFFGNVFLSIPSIILLYLIISILHNLFGHEIQS